MLESDDAAFWSFGLMAVIIMIGLFSPVGAVMATIVGLIALYFMGILSMLTMTFVIIAAVIAVIISMKVRE